MTPQYLATDPPVNPTPYPSIGITPPPGRGVSIGGIMSIKSASDLIEEARRNAELTQQQPVIQSLVSYVRKHWEQARTAKEQTVEQRLLANLRQRKGEYDPQRLAAIRKFGGSEIFMMITSAKCRAAASWLRDVMLASGSEKPWTLKPTSVPTLPPQMVEELRMEATQRLASYMQITGMQMPPADVRAFLQTMRQDYLAKIKEEAQYKVEAMEQKMEDQLNAGGFYKAFDQFIDDFVTFPAAFIKGPVIKKKKKLMWLPSVEKGYTPDIQEQIVVEWERVDPFMIYPSPASCAIDDGYLFERHKMRKEDLEQLIGVEGYNSDAIRAALDQYDINGLNNWLMVDTSKADVEGKSTTAVMNNSDGLIDALQYWGSVSGKMLVEWGMEEAEVEDQSKQYDCEVWLIGNWVIKATLNFDPLGRKPYYKACYEEIPGSFWGNAPPDMIRDDQEMCNSAARAIANNMAVASGPQVAINVDRTNPGEDITNIFPWKVWQFTTDEMGSTADAIKFFQPNSFTQELMLIFDKFSLRADEDCNIPRYMTGDSVAGGAGRTASGFSMLQTNANKGMKQVVANVDISILTPLLERLYFYNMKYGEDNTFKGDVEVVARGSAGVLAKETTQVRRNEFLIATANPMDFSIMGPAGRAELLRSTVKTLDMDVDKVVPSPEKMRIINQLQQLTAPPEQGSGTNMPGPTGSPSHPTQNGQTLQDGKPITDNFSPKKQPAN